MLRKFAVGALCTLAIVACGKKIEGLLTNTEALTFNIKKKTATIPAGRWATTIKFESKKEVKLIITNAASEETTVSFKVPKGAPLPQENGSFELSSALSGQPYDVQGSVQTTNIDSEEQWAWEGCTYQVRRQECYYNGHNTTCHWVYYDVHGQRDVRYFLRESTQVVNFNLVKTDKLTTPGTFQGTERSTERMYTYQGMCR